MKPIAIRSIAVAIAALLLASPAVQAQEAEVLALINAYRAKKGCDPLTLNPSLQAAAELHARNMAEQNFFDHKGKDGSSFSRRIKGQGFGGSRQGENIAVGQKTAAEVVEAWMTSPGHKKIIMNCNYSETGVALYHQADDQPFGGRNYAFYYYWVQTFGG